MFDRKIVMSLSGLTVEIIEFCATVRNLSWKILKDDLKNVLKMLQVYIFNAVLP